MHLLSFSLLIFLFIAKATCPLEQRLYYPFNFSLQHYIIIVTKTCIFEEIIKILNFLCNFLEFLMYIFTFCLKLEKTKNLIIVLCLLIMYVMYISNMYYFISNVMYDLFIASSPNMHLFCFFDKLISKLWMCYRNDFLTFFPCRKTF